MTSADETDLTGVTGQAGVAGLARQRLGLPQQRLDLAAPPLLIAAHGTRDAAGVAACHTLVERVRGMLAGIPVEVAYVELVEPGIDAALRELLTRAAAGGEEPRAVVVPLMLGTGGHVQEDIPEAIAAAQADVPGSVVGYARPLGPDPRLVRALERRIDAAAHGDGQDWDLRDCAVVLLGRGAKVAEANAEHAGLARLMYERTGASAVYPAYLQVTRPSLPEALSQATRLGAHRIVVSPNFLLPGLLRTWAAEQVEAWTVGHQGVQVRIAEVIGDCEELGQVVCDRYREAGGKTDAAQGAPVYLAGLRLEDRQVLVVGGGHVADRRVPALVDAGARVRLVSPTISVRLRRLLGTTDRLRWERRGYADGDVAGAWYVLALTNDPGVNEQVAAHAEAARVFCVRADAARLGTAWTPATTLTGGLTVAVIGDRDPRRSVAVRDAVAKAIHG